MIKLAEYIAGIVGPVAAIMLGLISFVIGVLILIL